MNGRIFVIGDIHGELNKLNNLLDNLKIEKSDRFIFLGDYVDRGPNSCGVIERLLTLYDNNSCHFILGNHDYEFFKDSFTYDSKHKSKPIYKQYCLWEHGARETYMSYVSNNKLPEDHRIFYKMLKPYLVETINNKKCIFVHAGFNRHKKLKSQDEDITNFIYDRGLLSSAIAYELRIFDDTYPFRNKDEFDYIYVGHTPVRHWGYTEPTLFKNVWALDTGVGKYEDSELYALEVITNKIYK